MVLPLVAVAMALLSKKLQDEDQKRATIHQINRDEATNSMNIAAQRAGKAGDSGYMQSAMRGAIGFPQGQPSQAGGTIAGVGSALMSQRDQPETPSNTTAPQLRMNDTDAYKPALKEEEFY